VVPIDKADPRPAIIDGAIWVFEIREFFAELAIALGEDAQLRSSLHWKRANFALNTLPRPHCLVEMPYNGHIRSSGQPVDGLAAEIGHKMTNGTETGKSQIMGGNT
jgi:hypothetical protein